MKNIKKVLIVIMASIGIFLLYDLVQILIEYFSGRSLIRDVVEEKLQEQKDETAADSFEHHMEMKKKFVEAMMMKYGARPIFTKNQLKLRMRTTFVFKDTYYRIDDGKFDDKDYIFVSAISAPDYADVGLMEEIAAFPWDLPDELLEKEVRYVFGIEEYPLDYPNYKV